MREYKYSVEDGVLVFDGVGIEPANKSETAMSADIERLEADIERLESANKNRQQDLNDMVAKHSQKSAEIERLKAEYEVHTNELDETIADQQQIIDNNEYKMRTIWYRGREWASFLEVDLLCREEIRKIKEAASK
jgi:archaellum component FlaC